MKFRNYCVVIIGNTLGVTDEIVKISETTPNLLDAKGLLIATFSSISEPNELTEWFKQNNRNFLLFDLSKENSGFNIMKDHIHEGLFGFLRDSNTQDMSDNFIKAMEPKTSSINKLSEAELTKMPEKKRAELLNELIEFGLDKLSENDKKLLHLLAK